MRSHPDEIGVDDSEQGLVRLDLLTLDAFRFDDHAGNRRLDRQARLHGPALRRDKVDSGSRAKLAESCLYLVVGAFRRQRGVMLGLRESKVLLRFVELLIGPDALLAKIVRTALRPLGEIQPGRRRTDSPFDLRGLHVEIEFAGRDFQLQRLYPRPVRRELGGVGGRQRRFDERQHFASLDPLSHLRKVCVGRGREPSRDRRTGYR